MNDTTRTLIAFGLAVGLYFLYKQLLDVMLDFYNRVEGTKDKETTE